MTGNAKRWVRWLEADLGLFVAGGRPIGATVPIAYRLGIPLTGEGTIAGDDLRTVSEEWGGMLAVLNAAALDGTEQTATLDLERAPVIRALDRRSDRYLRDRFEAEFTIGLKMLLLAVESELNLILTIVPHTSKGHEEAVFRLRTVALFHALTTLRRIVLRYTNLRSSGIRELGEVLDENPVLRLLSKQGKTVRNRCMHYQILNQDLALDPALPMFGIIEAVSGNTMEEVDGDQEAVIRRVAQLLSGWRAHRHR